MNHINQTEDISLIEKIKESNDNESLKTLIKKHEPMCFSIYKKYSNLINASGSSVEELSSDRGYVVYKSAISFDLNKKSKFSTWLYNQIRYQCLNFINENKDSVAMESEKINFLIESNNKQFGKTTSEDIKNINEYIFRILDSSGDSRISKIYRLRYFSGKKLTAWSKIANALNISTQTAINLHKKGVALLKVKLNSKNFLERV